MIDIANPTTAGSSTCLEPSQTKHCVFRCGQSWFSVPAIAVREIVMAPEMVTVPSCHPAVVGLGRLRSEFIPVIQLDALLELETQADLATANCLMVLAGNTPWSLLISESGGLESMETIVSPEAQADNIHNVLIGTAMYQDSIVRVLNAKGLLNTVQRVLDSHWQHSQN